jgi:hypothetical protein
MYPYNNELTSIITKNYIYFMPRELPIPSYNIQDSGEDILNGVITNLNHDQYELVTNEIPFLVSETAMRGFLVRHPLNDRSLQSAERMPLTALVTTEGLDFHRPRAIAKWINALMQEMDALSEIEPTLDAAIGLSKTAWRSRWELRTQFKPKTEKPQGLNELFKKDQTS